MPSRGCPSSRGPVSTRFASPLRASPAATPIEENPASDAIDTTPAADFNSLSGDEIERLIALCEAPVLLWEPDPGPARAPEPFGMIA